jgi:hypothetical protein
VRSSAAWHMSTGPCDTVGDVLQRIEEDTIEELVRSGDAEGPQSLVDIPTQPLVMFYRLARSRVESIHMPILKQASEFLAEDIGDRFMGVEDAINSQPPPLGCAVRRRLLMALSSHRTTGQLVPVVMRQSPQQLRNGFYYWRHDLPPT